MAGTLFFRAFEAATGFELWVSDGTAAGTSLVEDIIPGTGSSIVNSLTAAGGRAFFEATADPIVLGDKRPRLTYVALLHLPFPKGGL